MDVTVLDERALGLQLFRPGEMLPLLSVPLVITVVGMAAPLKLLRCRDVK